jgi:CRISPR-associated protein Cas2
MLVVVTYDVNISQTAGAKRLRKVAKLCERFGIRVQNSVFEVLVDAAQLVVLKNQLEAAIDPELDSIRFYRLGNSYQQKIEVMGKARRVETGAPLLL